MNTSFPKLSVTLLTLIGTSYIAPMAVASPWLEANDPFVRSSLLTLSDANAISGPVGTYPLRWVNFGDDLQSFNPGSGDVNTQVSQQELLYTLNSAKLNRGNRQFKVYGGRHQPYNQGFGETQQEHWGVTSSYEQLSNSFAFRVSSSYRDYNDEQEFAWHNSYLTLNAGSWLFSLGNLNRWWGQGWQHSLILNTKAHERPDLSISYLGDNSLFGVWNIESIITKPELSGSRYYNGTRFNAKPLSFWEYGLTYQYWDRDTENKKQWAFDSRLTLPSVFHVQHSLYGEIVSHHDKNDVAAWLLGWTGSRAFGQQVVRLVLEMQKQSNDGGWMNTDNDNQRFLSSVESSYLRDNSYSAAIYMQFSNDHNASLSFQTFDVSNQASDDSVELIKATYQFPALAGMLNLGIDYPLSNNTNSTSTHSLNLPNLEETNFWGGYEFRF